MRGEEAQRRESAELWLSGARLRTYLDPCGGDFDMAMGLYRWNIRLASAVLRDIALFEVALRNAYDRCLSTRLSGDWLLDAGSPVRRPILRTNRRGNARDQNRINRRTIDALAAGGRSHDWIVSNLTLGFWAHMTDRSHERDLWIPYLHHVWPAGSNRADVAMRIATINGVRNRAVHHEHLFNPARSGISVTLAVSYMTDMFPHLVPQEFRDAFPDMQPTEASSFLRESLLPSGVSL